MRWYGRISGFVLNKSSKALNDLANQLNIVSMICESACLLSQNGIDTL